MSFNFFQRYIHRTENYNSVFKLFGRIFLYLIPMRVMGAWFYMNPHQTAVAIQFLSGTHDAYSIYAFSKLLKRGMVVCDLGAHIGLYTIVAAKAVGMKGKVYSFEPEPDNYKFLLRNIKLNKCSNTYPYQLAIANKSGKAKLFLSGNSQDHSLVAFKRSRTDFVKVSQDTLDNILNNQKVDLIKIDVQGVEESCIEGMRKIINKNKKLMMVVEFWPEGLRCVGTKPLDFLKKLSNRFQVNLLDELRWKTVLVDDFAGLLSNAETVGYVNLLLKRK